MHVRLFFLFFCLFIFGFSQNNTKKDSTFNQKIIRLKNQDNLEEYYYAYFDFFMDNPIVERTALLKQAEISKWRKPKSNNEKIAVLHLKITLAYHYLVFGHLKQSINYYENALNYYESKQIKNYDITTYCLKPLGNNYTRIGDFERAEELFKYTIDLSIKNNNSQNLVATYLNYSIVLQTLYKNKKAINLLDKALLIKGISNSKKQEIKSAIAKNYYLLNDYSKALNILNTLHYKSYQNQITKSLCYFKLNDLDIAENILINTLKKISLKNTSNRDIAKIYTVLAKINFDNTKYKNALTNYKNALSYLLPKLNENKKIKSEDLFAENTLLDIFDGKANVYLKLNQPKKAIDNYQFSVRVESLLQKIQSSQQAKIISQQNNRKRIEKIISIYYNRYTKTNDIIYIQKAFKSVEISKSKVLLEKLYQNSFKNNIINDRLIIHEKELIREKANLSQKINTENIQRENADIQLIKKLINEKAKTTTKLEVLKQQIALKYPFISNGLDTVSIKNIKEVLLKKNQLLIEFFDTKKHLYIFSISKNKTIKWRRIIKDDEYNNTLQTYINLFVSENGNRLKTEIDTYLYAAYYLYGKLLKPELQNNTESNITLILDGKLNFVSFDALLTNQVNYSSFKDLPYLLFQKSLNYGYSTQILTKQKNTIYKEYKNKSILGVFPYFEDNYRGLQELFYTLNERKSLTNNYSNFLMLDKAKATKEQFLKNANNFSVLHLSTHANAGNFDEPAHIEFRDKTLFLPEIYGLNLQSDLLVLSACETGIGKLQKGEGAISLARGFLYAGIKKLIVSQWKVNDKSTSILMRNFYSHYKNNNNVTTSLHQAKIDYLQNDQIANLKKTPYYWSGFMFIGNTETPNTINYFYIVFGITLIGLFFIRKRYRKA